MTTPTQTRADARALISAAVTGSAFGLLLIVAGQLGAVDRVAPEAAAQMRGPVAVVASQNAAAANDLRGPVQANILPVLPNLIQTTLDRESIRMPALKAQGRDLECLTEAVYFESRGQPIAGQGAVAQVILNRSRHPAYPSTICGVVHQGRERGSCQFSYACHSTSRRKDVASWREAEEIATAALEGRAPDYVGTATSFHATRVRPRWGGMVHVSTVGQHVFYRFAGAKGAPSAFRGSTQPSTVERSYRRPEQDTLFQRVARPIQSALAAEVVETATTPPEPILSLPVAAPASAPAAAPESLPNEATLQPVSSTPAVSTAAVATVS